jgi:hypothetical protein
VFPSACRAEVYQPKGIVSLWQNHFSENASKGFRFFRSAFAGGCPHNSKKKKVKKWQVKILD